MFYYFIKSLKNIKEYIGYKNILFIHHYKFFTLSNILFAVDPTYSPNKYICLEGLCAPPAIHLAIRLFELLKLSP